MSAPDHPTAPVVTRVPGIGTSLQLHDTEGRAWSALVCTDGHVELHPPNAGTPLLLGEGDAAALGAFLTGGVVVAPGLADRARSVLGGLVLDRVEVRPRSYAAGRSIEELAIRRRTGVTIVAVLRGSLPLVAPDPGTRLEARDDLVVIGRPDDVPELARYLTAGP